MIRVSRKFAEWIKGIIEEKNKMTIKEHEKLTSARVTQLIPTNKAIAPQLREDILNYYWGENER